MATKTTKNEVAKVEAFALTPISDDMKDMITEELAGLGPVPFDVVKIPSGGGLSFQIPSDDPENPDEEKVLSGVIIYHHPVNSYWPGEYVGGNEPPKCMSMDGKMGLDTETGEMRQCAECPLNQFGSDDNGTGKACKNGHRIYLLRDGEMLPLLLLVPPTSLKPLKEYLAKRIIIKGMRPSHVITEITLTQDKNATGIKYSKCVFKKVSELPKEQRPQAEAMTEAIKAMAMNVPINAETSEFVETEADDFDA